MEYLASVRMALPEDILSLGALALMLVAAWGGQRSTRAVSWCSVAVLLGAGIALFATPHGVAFDGLLLVDAFSTFAKVLIYVAAAIAMRRAHVRLYQGLSWLFTPVYQSDSRSLPFVRDRLVGPLSRLWPATVIQAAMVAGLVGDPLGALGLEAAPASES